MPSYKKTVTLPRTHRHLNTVMSDEIRHFFPHYPHYFERVHLSYVINGNWTCRIDRF